MKRLAMLAAILVSSSLASEARASDKYDVFIPVGGSIAYTLNPGKLDNGAAIGAEASLVWLNHDRPVWFGAYVDALHDFGSESSRISLGPELGFAIFGMDGGAVLSTLDGVHAGVCGRFLISLVFMHAYIRVGTIFDSPREGTYGEIGVMLKFPITLESPLFKHGAPVRTAPPVTPPDPPRTDP